MDGEAQAHIAAAIEAAEQSGEPIDGLTVGREAAARAIASYMDAGEPQAAIDGEFQDDRPQIEEGPGLGH